METAIYYYTGTGNSLWVARTLGRELGDAAVVSIPRSMCEKSRVDARVIGFVFPVHIWGVPPRILDFIRRITEPRPEYIFAIAVDAGQVANTLVQLKRILKVNGLALASGFEIVMPSNYIPWGGPGPEEKQNRRFASAEEKISRIAMRIKQREKAPVEKGPLWQRVLFTLIYQLSVPYIPKMDGKFWVDAKCNSCAVCAQICPAQNIRLIGDRPVWQHKCEQCFACIQWCPREAIQYGKKTPRYERYHHPGVNLKDLLD